MEQNICLKSGGMNILASGTAITFVQGADLQVCLKLDADFSLDIIFQFKDNPTQDKAELQIDTSDNEVMIICVNFNDFIGVGTLKPLNLFTHNGKTLYLNFWVRTPQEKTVREVKYCFYFGGD